MERRRQDHQALAGPGRQDLTPRAAPAADHVHAVARQDEAAGRRFHGDADGHGPHARLQIGGQIAAVAGAHDLAPHDRLAGQYGLAHDRADIVGLGAGDGHVRLAAEQELPRKFLEAIPVIAPRAVKQMPNATLLTLGVAAVARPLAAGDLGAARQAVAVFMFREQARLIFAAV